MKLNNKINVPSHQYFYKYVLEALLDEQSYERNNLIEKVANLANLTKEQKQIVMRKGALQYKDRIAWSLTHLKKAGLVSQPQRAYWQITAQGKEFINNNSDGLIGHKDLMIFPGYQDFTVPKESNDSVDTLLQNTTDLKTPTEMIENVLATNVELLKSDLLEMLKSRDPYLFEHTCKDLLLAMGYAGGIEEFANVTQRSNDGGIDCVIKQDPLGVSNIYIQAKRYEGTVHEKEVRNFIGALNIKQAQSGVMITTGDYSKKAKNAAEQANCNVVLINGNELVYLMIKYRVGVERKSLVELLKVDEDYFSDI